MVVQNRLLFLKNLQSGIQQLRSKLPADPHVQSLRCPKFMDYVMQADSEYRFAEVVLQLSEHQLDYPFVIKLLQASRTTHAHSFYVITSEKGLLEALAFEGFQGEHLLF